MLRAESAREDPPGTHTPERHDQSVCPANTSQRCIAVAEAPHDSSGASGMASAVVIVAAVAGGGTGLPWHGIVVATTRAARDTARSTSTMFASAFTTTIHALLPTVLGELTDIAI